MQFYEIERKVWITLNVLIEKHEIAKENIVGLF